MVTEIQSQEDVRRVFTIFSEIWGEETLSELVSSIHHTTCLVEKIWTGLEDYVVGYMFYGLDERTNTFEITDIGVSLEYQNRGHGYVLIKHLFKTAKKVALTVRADNYPARRLYTKLGFKETQTYENYYGVGSDGIRMQWEYFEEG